MDDIDIILTQGPALVTREVAQEALMISSGDVCSAVQLLWEREDSKKKEKWASVRDVFEAITSTPVNHKQS